MSERVLWTHRKQTVSLLQKEGFIISQNESLAERQFQCCLI